jgi:hypothetical protein
MNSADDLYALIPPTHPNCWVGRHPDKPGEYMPTLSIGGVLFFTKDEAKQFIKTHGPHEMLPIFDFMRAVHQWWRRNEMLDSPL